MKNIAFSVFIVCVIIFSSCKDESKTDNTFNEQKEKVNEEQQMDGHTSINTLDWEGTYAGTIPCDDCDGIFTELTLNNDNTFIMHTTKMLNDKQTKSSQEGLYKWDESGSTVILGKTGFTSMYKVAENKLILLDKDASEFPESETKNYTLIKKLEKEIN